MFRILIFLMMLSLSSLSAPILAADTTSATPKSDTQPAEQKKDAATAGNSEKKNADNDAGSASAHEEKKVDPSEIVCPYYTVKLPANWKVVLPPEERQGLVNAIFATNSNSTVVSMIIGPRGGADAATIAGMFADQFKAPKAPVEKNGQYYFSFTQNDALGQKDVSANACVSIYEDNFMVTTYSGNQKDARNFLKKNLSSVDYGPLMPN